MIIKFCIFLLLLLKISLTFQNCIKGSNYCSRCNPVTKLCIECVSDIYTPDEFGGCKLTKKCERGNHYCLQCSYEDNLCNICDNSYYPDEIGRCSYTDKCQISSKGICLKCREDYILIGITDYIILDQSNNIYEGLKMCKSLLSEDFLNCEKISQEKGYCKQCKKGFYLNKGDRKCTDVLNCLESSFGVCKKCIEGYYLDKKENKCLRQNGILNHCQESINSINCDTCENKYFFDENGKCVNTKFCTEGNENGVCIKCLEGYYLSNFDNICTSEKECLNGIYDIGICNLCIDGYYIDYKDGKCKSNQEDNEFKFCKIADNNKCKECIENYHISLDNKCTKAYFCEEVENGICKRCSSNLHLSLDNNCTLTEHCKYTNGNECIECEDKYYYNRNNRTCMLEEGIFNN